MLPLPNLRSDLIHRPGEGLRFGKPMSCAARNPLNSLSGRHSGRSEQRSIDQHAMHDHGELAGERHLCLLHAGAFGKPHRPALEGCAALQRLGQDDVAGLVERRSHSLVADLADPSPSRPREFHPQSLTEPCLTLSRHTARAIVGRHHPSAALSGSSRFRLAQRNYDGLLPSLQSHYRTFITTMKQSEPDWCICTFGLGLLPLRLFL